MNPLRFGPCGDERPGLLDNDGVIRDLSKHIMDLNPAALAPASVAHLAGPIPGRPPQVMGNPRLGVPVGGIGKFTSVRFRQTIIAPGFDAVGNTYLTPIFGANPFNTTDDTPFAGLTSEFSDEYAPFADLTYRFTPQWSLSTGMRWHDVCTARI